MVDGNQNGLNPNPDEIVYVDSLVQKLTYIDKNITIDLGDQFTNGKPRPLTSADVLYHRDDENGDIYYIHTTGLKDCMQVALVPDKEGHFSTQILYTNPKANKTVDYIEVDDKSTKKILRYESSHLPKGSLLLLLSDGGLEAIAEQFGQENNDVIADPMIADIAIPGAIKNLFTPFAKEISKHKKNGDLNEYISVFLSKIKYDLDDTGIIIVNLDAL